MNYKKIFFLASCFILCLGFSSCKAKQPSSNEKPPVGDENTNGEITDNNEIDIKEPDTSDHKFTLISESNGTILFKCQDCSEEKRCVISHLSGTTNAYQVEGNTLTFNNIKESTSYDISGSFYGNIIINANNSKFELQMSGLDLYSYSDSPITILNGDKVTLSAKKSTENYIYDMREEITDETSISASIYSLCDLDIQGKGSLFVKSINNNGIHTKDDLSVKNLSLQVDCKDNALKGNDSVTIESGSITLIARQGDGIKTTNSNLSSKGKQKGTISLTGGDILIYAACDGLDAAYNVELNEASTNLNLQVFTDKYSKYSEEVTAVTDSLYYVRFNSTTYKYSLKFYNDETDVSWQNSSSSKVVGNQRYYPITKPSGYSYVQLYIYNSTQEQGQDQNYIACTEEMKVNSNYDTIAIQSRGNTLSYSWTNYTTQANPGRPGGQGGFGGFGGMNDVNTDKGDHSTKGIKADNLVIITAGTITISAYDDAIHANNDTSLENGESPLGDITISGGTLTLRSNDDGIHAEGNVSINGGTINIIGSYEGIEGSTVEITDGDISIVSTDDGINGCKTSGTTITISGGKLYVYASGDGVDSNSTSPYEGIHFAGGVCVIISTGQADSSIDTERGYKYTGGYVIGIGKSGGMGNESTMCGNFSSIGTSRTISLQKDSYLVINDIVTIQSPISMNALIVCLGKTNAGISSSPTNNYTLDSNGVYWNVN
ncbi:MAG: carbohydrate-binding domain-containing protein [Anaeroplasmataceae bacterium]|nr:carbohydrate-binding domain-containing protein [Anaeroplasmataceae bacterium]